jgi:hypothetical protein
MQGERAVLGIKKPFGLFDAKRQIFARLKSSQIPGGGTD